MCIKGSANMCTVYLFNTPSGGRYIGCWDLPGLICKPPVNAFEVLVPRMDPMHPFCFELGLHRSGHIDPRRLRFMVSTMEPWKGGEVGGSKCM